MSERVPADQIEQIVGVPRHSTRHYARAVSAGQTVYILHSQTCKEMTPDLRTCVYSTALDSGIDEYEWSDVEDRPVHVTIRAGRLVPVRLRLR